MTEREILGQLLLQGSPDFNEKLATYIADCANLPEGDCTECCSEARSHLLMVFDKTFPWMKNIVSMDKKTDNDGQELLDTGTKLYGLLEKYDLLKKDSLFRSICAIVWENIEDGISLHLVADKLNISADYAGRIFKKRTDIHFATFVMEVKMERGKELLANTRLKNYEISNRLGYSNPDYFRQLFKAYTGATPTEYRNAFRYRF